MRASDPTRWLRAPLALTLLACEPGSDSVCGEVSGELCNGNFELSGAPLDTDLIEGLPCVLVGGVFEVAYDGQSIDGPFEVRSFADDFVNGASPFTALRVGEPAFVAFRGGLAVDVLHVRFVEADEMVVLHDGDDATATVIEMWPDSVTQLDVYTRSSTCLETIGVLVPVVGNSDVGVAEVGVVDGRVEVHALEPGTAYLTITAGATEAVVVVTVSGPAATGSGGSSDGTSDGSDGTNGSSESASVGSSDGSESGTSTGGP